MPGDKRPSSVLKALPFENLIEGPLSACIAAQAESSRSTLAYIRGSSMEDAELGVNSISAVTVSFVYRIDGFEKVLNLPLLSIIPIPYINIDYVNLSFAATVTAFRGEQIQARYTAPWVENNQDGEAMFEEENRIRVDIHATSSEIPAGLARMLEVFGTRLIQVDKLEQEEIARLRKEYLQSIGSLEPDPKPDPKPWPGSGSYYTSFTSFTSYGSRPWRPPHTSGAAVPIGLQRRIRQPDIFDRMPGGKMLRESLEKAGKTRKKTSGAKRKTGKKK